MMSNASMQDLCLHYITLINLQNLLFMLVYKWKKYYLWIQTNAQVAEYVKMYVLCDL